MRVLASTRHLVSALVVTLGALLLGNEGCEGPGASSTLGQVCGGIAAWQCDPGQYCAFPAVSNPDGTGRCAKKEDGTACITLYDPVCGLDGQTYGNACFAEAAGVSVAHEGECGDPPPTCSGPAPGAPNYICPDGSVGGPVCVCTTTSCSWQIRNCEVAQVCGGFLGLACDEGEYCDYSSSEGLCGNADFTGECRVMPKACTLEYAPVCGCDGNTYSNACHAAGNGVTVAEVGACGSTGACDPVECGAPPLSPLPHECVRDGSGVCVWEASCLPTPCAAPPVGCEYVGGTACTCGTLECIDCSVVDCFPVPEGCTPVEDGTCCGAYTCPPTPAP